MTAVTMTTTGDISLSRMETSQPWGFRLKGGVDQGIPLHIEHVHPKGRAAEAGFNAGDLILAICGVPTQSMTHANVKSEMLRAGNDIVFTIQRDGSLTIKSPPPAASAPAAEARSSVVEEPIPKLGGPTYKNVTTKTFQVLEDTLPPSSTEDAGSPPAGNRPASIFDRKKDERSEYLKAKGPTIQKAYGQQH